ncbi:sporulation protein [Niallia sp. XMNu-256]|uniref:sporulation protein n=1 Tax=Niallia sp. XMNu-256 TaxID=3082444 RepID=UPI0030D0CB51
MKKLTKAIMMIFLYLGIVTGCNKNEVQGNQDYMTLMQTTNPTPTNIVSGKNHVTAEEIKKDVEKKREYIYDVAVIKGENEDLVVYKVKHLQRFRMNKIEKEITEMLEKKYPDENFVVSSDYKIFLEAVRLGEKMKDPHFSKKDAQKRLDEIIKLKNELT